VAQEDCFYPANIIPNFLWISESVRPYYSPGDSCSWPIVYVKKGYTTSNGSRSTVLLMIVELWLLVILLNRSLSLALIACTRGFSKDAPGNKKGAFCMALDGASSATGSLIRKPVTTKKLTVC
jgi:hypothetical protein